MLGVIYGEGKVDREEVKRGVIEHCRAICDLSVNHPFPLRSTLQQFQRYLDFWKRDEWEDLAAAAVRVLKQRETEGTGVYLGPGEAHVRNRG